MKNPSLTFGRCLVRNAVAIAAVGMLLCADRVGAADAGAGSGGAGTTALAAGGSVDATSLDGALRELRELREARYRLQAQWAEERAALQRQTDLDRAATTAARERLALQQAELAAAEAAVADVEARRTAVLDRRAALETSIVAGHETLFGGAGPNATLVPAPVPGLVSPAMRSAAAVALDPERPLAVRLDALLDAARGLADRATTVQVARQTILLDGERRDWDVLEVGGAAAWAVAPDDSACAFANSRRVWSALPAEQAAGVREAIAVAQGEVQPTLVNLYLPPEAFHVASRSKASSPDSAPKDPSTGEGTP